jgi:hypothetical protein
MNAAVSVKQTPVNPPTRTFPLVADHWWPKGLPELASIGFPFSKPTVDESIVLSNDFWGPEKSLEISATAPFAFLFRTLPRVEDVMSIESLAGPYDPLTQTMTMAVQPNSATTFESPTFKEAPTGLFGALIFEWVSDCRLD